MASPAGGQTADEEGYDFFGVSALADGITTRLVLEHFLAVEEFIALSSVSAEARLEIGRSTALAVLPDPGDLVLGLPGTLAALAGVAGLPDYPAVSRADYPTTPTHEVTLAPDAGLGALRLRTEAEEHRAYGRAFVGNFVDTVGVLPLSVGSIKSESLARRIDSLTYESVAKSTVNDIRLLGGIFRIGQVTSTVTARVDDGKITATRDETKVVGAEIAGMPVGIDEKGFTSPNGSEALAPLIDSLAAPLAAAGVTVRMTPGESTITATKGTATSGFLTIELAQPDTTPYPATITLSFGKASATVEASGRSSSLLDEVLSDVAGGVADLGLPAGGLDAAGGDLGSGITGDLASPIGGAASPGDAVTARVPVVSVELMDFRSLYRWVAVALLGALVARWWVVSRFARARYGNPSQSALSLEVVMATERQASPVRPALVQVTPEILERFRDPRIVLAIVCGIGGAVALLLGYLGVSDTLDPGQQLPYLISGGVGALFLLGLAATLLFSTDLGATRREIRELREDIAQLRELVEDQRGSRR